MIVSLLDAADKTNEQLAGPRRPHYIVLLLLPTFYHLCDRTYLLLFYFLTGRMYIQYSS